MTEEQLKQSIIDFRNTVINRCKTEIARLEEEYNNFPREDWDSKNREIEKVLYEAQDRLEKLKV